ncbi:MAG: amidohydrolase, partial [Gammaproteobacteria bacterium]|nr:amidohydrolase [Gammaproteobacteria bacterium]
MTIYLKDATFIDWKTFEIEQMNLAVQPGSSGSISISSTIPDSTQLGSGDRVIDCRGKYVTKSFGCGHHHIYSTLARGMPA